MKPEVKVEIVPVSFEDFTVAAKFAHKFFFPDEPLNSSLQRCPEPDDIAFMNCLKDGLSLMAVNATDRSEDNLMGLVINKKSSKDSQTDLSTITCPKQTKIYKILRELDEKCNFWSIVGADPHFEILSLSVNTKYRGLGIGRKLMEESLKLAKSLNFKYAAIECSSFYSARLALEMGFQLLGEIKYDEYLDENNERVFKIKEPHVALKKLVKKL